MHLIIFFTGLCVVTLALTILTCILPDAVVIGAFMLAAGACLCYYTGVLYFKVVKHWKGYDEE